MKKCRIALAALLCLSLFVPAMAEIVQGQTSAGDTVRVTLENTATVWETPVSVGERVTADTVVARLKTTTVYCAEDGYVSLLCADPGDALDGTVAEITPRHRYYLYCSAEKAYSEPENKLIHTGEMLYAKCTHDGTHTAIAEVMKVDGTDYEARTVAGELYVGETVNLFRDTDFTSAEKVGIATVTENAPAAYTGSGYLLSVDVDPGDTVQRGEKLFVTCECRESEITAGTDGTISMIAEAGTSTDTVAEIIPDDAVRITLTVSEENLHTLQRAERIGYIRADDVTRTEHSARIEKIAAVSSEEGYAVTLIPEQSGMPIGMSVDVIFD